jgi:hypothetical protein
MTIAATDVSSVPVSRVLRVIGLRGYWSFGDTFTCPSPRATAKQQQRNPVALKVGRDGAWTDQHSGRTGTDVAGLFAYIRGIGRAAALQKLAAALSPRDLMLDRCIRAGDVERAGPREGDTLDPTSPAVSGARLEKFARTSTPRMRSAALLQAATNARALDAVEDRKASRR